MLLSASHRCITMMMGRRLSANGQERCAMLTISSGYDPLYLTRAVATGRENYYLSAVAEHGEPPGIWTGPACPELGLRIGSEVGNTVMERLYGAFADPRGSGREGHAGAGARAVRGQQ